MGHSQAVSQDSYLEGVNTLHVNKRARTLETAAQIEPTIRRVIDTLTMQTSEASHNGR